jgi:subtilase family serine protease
VRMQILRCAECIAGILIGTVITLLRISELPQFAAVPSAQLESASTAFLTGHIHPSIRSARDLGAVEPSQQISLSLIFKPSNSQQSRLEKLLRDLEDPQSLRFHKWITAEDYAEAYGLSRESLKDVANWLAASGIVVRDVAPSRNRISFEATAAKAEQLFGIQLRRYNLNGEVHYANNGEPTVPNKLANLIVGIRGLHDFHLKPRSIKKRKRVVNAMFTSNTSGNTFLAPDDFATIYGVKGLYNSGIDGTNQKIAVVGQTDIKLSDIRAFRKAAGLAENDPQIVLDGSDPGTNPDDMVEADLDVEWAGAIAKGATIYYVNSTDVLNSFEYAITHNAAPVLSISYGGCETSFSTSEVQTLQSLAQQANSQGMTILAASGDSGPADCDYGARVATRGLAVDLPAALPYVTAVGGTRFVEGDNTSQYWNSANNSSNGSAISYIPEEGWNDTSAEGTLAASGGGVSWLFSKPSWQTGSGVPDDGHRDVPDVALSASADHDGYLICSEGSCVNGFRDSDNYLFVVGGTSAGVPSFAGVLALINQKYGAGQGNINPTLYARASGSPTGFHDISNGNNVVPCASGSKDCTDGSLGYSAGTGYDLVTGLGSIDAFNLAADWQNTDPESPDFQLSVNPASLTVKRNASATTTLTVAALNSFTGTVTLSCSVPFTFASSDCAISPSTISTSGTATVTIGTLKASLRASERDARATTPTSSVHISSSWRSVLAISLCLVALLFLSSEQLSRRIRLRVALGACTALLSAVCLGCGSSSESSRVSPGTYSFLVTGQSEGLTHSATIQVTVE